MERKEFIKKFAIGGSILFTAPMLFNACSDEVGDPDNTNPPSNNPNEIIIDLNHSDFSELNDVGGFAYKNDIIIFRTSDTNYVALSKLCTHSQCTITYNHSDNDLPCPCHGSKFSTSGTVTNGPADANLKKYTVVKDGTNLKIT